LNRSAQAIAQGAILAALAAVLGLAALYLPVIGALAGALWPLPIIVLILRFELNTGLMALAVALAIIAMTAGPLGALSLGLRGGLTALILGHAFKKNWSPGLTVLSGGVVTVLGTAVLLVVSFALLGGPLLDTAELERLVNETMDTYRRYGLLDPMLQQGITEEEVERQLRQAVSLALALVPGMMFISSLVAAGITYLLARATLKRLGYAIEPLPAFRYWQVPWYTVWGLILGLALLLAGDYLGYKPVLLIGQNIVYIYLPLLLINGLAVAVYYYHRWHLSPFLKAIGLAVMVINLPVTVIFLMIVGAFDPLFNYRKLSFGTPKGE